MRVTVGYETSDSAKAVMPFRCVHCGHRQNAEVIGIGQGMQSVFNAPGTARQRAAVDAKADVARTIARTRCPKCQRRDPNAVWQFCKPFVIAAFVMVALGVIGGMIPTWFHMNMREHDKAIVAWLVPLILIGTTALVMPIQMLTRWAGTDTRVRWLDD